MKLKSLRSTGKRLLSAILSLCIIIALVPTYVSASSSVRYVVLGDSISTGYGLTDGEKSFVDILKETYPLISESAFYNLAKDGDTSADLLSTLETSGNSYYIRNADIITITIGGNDMMDALYGFLAAKYNGQYSTDWTADDVKDKITDKSDPDYNSLITVATDNISSFPSSDEAKNKAKEVGNNLSKALKEIKNMNSKGTVIVANQYNPYTYAANNTENMLMKLLAYTVDRAFEGGIDLLNNEIKNAVDANGCTLADVYAAFKNATENPSCASFASQDDINLDFHPNAYGHGIIADTLKPFCGPVATGYTLTVENGTAYGSTSGEFVNGSSVRIIADPFHAGEHFSHWEAEPSTYNNNFTNRYLMDTEFTMPAEAVKITAVFEEHTLTHHDKIEPTCTTEGKSEYWECSDCGGIYTDANATEIVYPEYELIIRPLGHDWGDLVSNGDGTHTRECGRSGCTEEDTNKCKGGQASYFEKAVCDDCGGEYGELTKDTTAPEGTVSLGENKWETSSEDITFELFLNKTQTVTITADDDSIKASGYTEEKAPKIGYYISSAQMTQDELESVEFEDYTEPFSIDADGKYIVYAKITDYAGNVTYINTNGFVIDTTAPSAPGIESVKTYCGPVEMVISEENLAEVTVNSEPVAVTDGKITIVPAEGVQIISVKDKAGNVTNYNLTVNDGHTFKNYVSDENFNCTDDGTKTAKCEFCDATNTIADDGSAAGHIVGEWIYDENSHWQECEKCSEILNKEEHKYYSDLDRDCDVCGHVRKVAIVSDIQISYDKLTEGVDGTAWNTPEKVTERFMAIFKEKGYSETNTVVFDANLTGTLTVNGVELKEGVDYFPKDIEFKVVIPYPKGTDKNTEEFSVLHMFSASSNVLGTNAGDIEILEPVKLENGLQVTLKGLSPIAVAWKNTDDGTNDNQGTNDPTKPDTGTDNDNGSNTGTGTGTNTGTGTSTGTSTSGTNNKDNSTQASPETGDNTAVAQVIAVMMFCAVTVIVVLRKRLLIYTKNRQ